MENKIVYKILKEENGYADVMLDREVFKTLAGFETALPYKTGVSKSGEGVRIYTVSGVPVYRRFIKGETKADDKYQFKMKSEDAQALLITNTEALPFSFADTPNQTA